MNKIFVVTCKFILDTNYYSSDAHITVSRAFFSLEKAEKFCEKQPKRYDVEDDCGDLTYSIEETELED